MSRKKMVLSYYIVNFRIFFKLGRKINKSLIQIVKFLEIIANKVEIMSEERLNDSEK